MCGIRLSEHAVTRTRTHSPRLIRLVKSARDDGIGVFALTAKNRTQFYVFKEIACDIGGRGFMVHRLGLADVYHARIGASAESSCECMGFLRHGHCKHLQALTALIGHELI